MAKRLQTPQEVEVWILMPAIRREFAKYLKAIGLKQKEVARLLGVTIPAISQYMNNKRANDVVFSSDIKERIKESADLIAKTQSSSQKELQKILGYIKDNGKLCTICNKYGDVPESCDVCFN